jgi:hypothetical protein
MCYYKIIVCVKVMEWNLDIPKPNLEQLEQYEAQANIVESNQVASTKRIKEYVLCKQIEYILKMARCLTDKLIL